MVVENTISAETVGTVKAYVESKYPSYKGVEMEVNEKNGIFFINKHKDGSPLILSSSILG